MDDTTAPSISTELEGSAPEMISRSSEDPGEDIETHNQNLSSHEVCTEMEETSITTAGVHASGVDDALVSINLTEEERSKLMNVMAKAKVNLILDLLTLLIVLIVWKANLVLGTCLSDDACEHLIGLNCPVLVYMYP